MVVVVLVFRVELKAIRDCVVSIGTYITRELRMRMSNLYHLLYSLKQIRRKLRSCVDHTTRTQRMFPSYVVIVSVQPKIVVTIIWVIFIVLKPKIGSNDWWIVEMRKN